MITLPKILESILLNAPPSQINNSIISSVHKTINNANELLQDKLILSDYFFPDYTDHGVTHINDVLHTAADLIHEDTIKKLQSIDVLLLVSAVICHDIAMNLTPSTLKPFFNEKYDKETFELVKLLKIESLPWVDSFKNFHVVDQKKNPQLIDEEFQEIDFDTLIEKLETKNFTLSDRKIIGVFIRENHARFAFEIAINGLSDGTKKPKKILEFEGFPRKGMEFRILSGAIAWSHNYYIKDTFELLKKRIGSYAYGNALDSKTIYLMGLLRIADIMQVLYSRVGSYKYANFRTITSEYSKNEFKKHRLFFTIHPVDYRPGCLNIHVEIESPSEYTFAYNCIEDIKREIAHSKEFLSRFYGGHSDLKFKYDQIYSNILSSEFLKTINFHHSLLSYSISPEIFPIFVEPLYGKNIKYGIRELIQNGVDACIQKKLTLGENENYSPEILISKLKTPEFLKPKPNKKNEKVKDEKHKIEDKIENCLVFIDNGIGMDNFDIEKYYLKIGKSIKTKPENLGNGLIGKFGVGGLSTFLLGDKFMCVSKKSKNEKIYFFEIERHKMNSIEVFFKKKNEFIEKNIELDQSIINFIKNEESFTIFIIPISDNLDGEDDVSNFIWYLGNEVKIKLNNVCINNNIFSDNQTFESFVDEKNKELFEIYFHHTNLFEIEQIGNFKIDISTSAIVNGFIIDHKKNTSDRKLENFIIRHNENSIYINPVDYDNNDIKISLPASIIIDKFGNFPLKLSRSEFSMDSEFYSLYAKNTFKKVIDNLKNLTDVDYFNDKDKIAYSFSGKKMTTVAMNNFEFGILYLQGQSIIFTRKNFKKILETIKNKKIILFESTPDRIELKLRFDPDYIYLNKNYINSENAINKNFNKFKSTQFEITKSITFVNLLISKLTLNEFDLLKILKFDQVSQILDYFYEEKEILELKLI